MGTGSSGAGSRGMSAGKSVTDYDGSKIDMSHAPLKYGKDDDTLKGSVKEAIAKFEDKRMKQKIEYGTLVDGNGNVISEKRGGKGAVKMLVKDYEKAVAMTHIHPRQGGSIGGSFSQGDIEAFIRFPKLLTMRAVAKEGTYSISKAKGFNANGLKSHFIATETKLRGEYTNVAKKLANEYKSGKIDYDTYSKAHDRAFNKYLSDSHKALLDGQKKFGYNYTLERRKK